MRNIDKLKNKYERYWVDMSIEDRFREHKHYHFVFGDYIVSVIQEPHYKGDNDLEYAIIYNDYLTYLETEKDEVARYKTVDEVDKVLHEYKMEEGLE